MAKQLTMEEMQRKLERLEKRVKKLEEERDEARDQVVWDAIFSIIRKNGMHRFRGGSHYVTSDQYRDINMGKITLQEATAERNERWPLFLYWFGKLTLKQAYEMSK